MAPAPPPGNPQHDVTDGATQVYLTKHDSLTSGESFYPPERRARYLFYFCCFVRFLSTITRQPAGQFTPNFASGRTLVPNVSSPLLGVGGPRRAEKGENEIFVTMGVTGEFLHFCGF